MQIHSTKPVTPEQAEIFLSTFARRSADKFVQALRSGPPFQDTARGKIFGIILQEPPNSSSGSDENSSNKNDEDNVLLGNLIYKSWLEIYQRRLIKDGTEDQFQRDLIQALLSAELAPTFQQWMEEAIADNDDSIVKDSCQKLKDQNLDLTLVIHPTDSAHREHMERFRDKKL